MHQDVGTSEPKLREGMSRENDVDAGMVDKFLKFRGGFRTCAHPQIGQPANVHWSQIRKLSKIIRDGLLKELYCLRRIVPANLDNRLNGWNRGLIQRNMQWKARV